jgi:hypothetical protein
MRLLFAHRTLMTKEAHTMPIMKPPHRLREGSFARVKNENDETRPTKPTKGNFEIGAGPAPGSPVKGHYISAIIDAKTFSGYEGGLSRQEPAVRLAA